jgi:hypothetical protein
MSDAESSAQAAHDAVVKQESTMKTTIVAALIVATFGSTSALAQNSGMKGTAGNATATGANPASAGEAIGQPASAGKITSGNQGSLMQQRQKAMSPQGSSAGAATATIKQ